MINGQYLAALAGSKVQVCLKFDHGSRFTRSELYYIVAEDKPLDSSEDLWELLGDSRKEVEHLYPHDPKQRGVESNQKTFLSYLYWHKLSTARAWHHNCADQQRKWTHAPRERTEPYKVKDPIPRDRTNSRLPAETQ